MKRVGTLLAVIAPLGLLAACGPAETGISAIGYDSQGRLVGAVKVCEHRFSRSYLTPAHPDGARPIGSWHRKPSLQGTESWLLRDGGAGPWQPAGPALPDLAAGTRYVFWTQDRSESSRSDFLVFTGSDLARLTPGQVLIRREPTDQGGRLAVIALSELAGQSCSG